MGSRKSLGLESLSLVQFSSLLCLGLVGYPTALTSSFHRDSYPCLGSWCAYAMTPFYDSNIGECRRIYRITSPCPSFSPTYRTPPGPQFLTLHTY